MKKVIHIFIIGLLGAAFCSCTSARWTVKKKNAIDASDSKILQRDNFLKQSDEVSPQNPILRLELYSKTKVEYAQRVLLQRNIQEYRLRPGFVALGLTGAAMTFYLANSNTFRGAETSAKSVTLNGIGALIAVSGFLNMKPVGDPRPTGEERYLRNTGTAVQIDTVKAPQGDVVTSGITVRHNGQIIMEEQRSFSTGSIEITLAGKLNKLQLTGPDPGTISVDVTFEDSLYSFSYPIEEVLQPYARVTSQLTELRNSPEESADNVLADLVMGSQLRIQSSANEEWFQVLYGISENYVRKDDVELIWRSADFIEGEQVVTVPRVPFGNIDVESNIPILRGPSPNAIALIVTNQNYSGELQERNYAHRDGQLIKTYLKNALGYQQQNIFELADVDSSGEIFSTLSKIRRMSNDSTELVVYLSGHGEVSTAFNEPDLRLLGISGDDENRQSISLKNIFDEISFMQFSKVLVLSDIDFSSDVDPGQFSSNEARQIIDNNAASLTSNNSRASLLMGTRLANPSSLYVSSEGEDKKHHIFPYFFAKALQERRTSLSDIYQYLERNVSYTARKLFDRPQDPLLIGNTSLDLASQ